MSKPVKIFELKMEKWMDGLSRQSAIAVGGLFSSISNFDPFEVAGMMQPSLASVVASDLSITNTPLVITPFQVSAVSKLYVHTADKLYQVLDASPYTTVDKTAQITATSSVRGAAIFNGYYVYSLNNTIRARILPVDSGSDVQCLGLASDNMWHPMCVGADGNLYVADFSCIAKITKSLTAGNGVLGVTGNIGSAIALESGMYVRGLINDGRYLVILADNNSSHDAGGGATPIVPIAGKFRCQILFWDMIKSTFDQIYEFNDSYLTGAAYLDGGIYVFGGDNLYVCNIATPPKAILNFKTGSTITEKPTTPFQIVQARNSIYWCGQSNGAIYAYGSLFPGMKKVFYQPFSSTVSTPSAITFNGTNFYIGTSAADNFLRVTHTGSTRNGGTVITAPIVLDQPYKFAFAKFVMRRPLASGDSVAFSLQSGNSDYVISDSVTKNFTEVGAKQEMIFERTPPSTDSADVDTFEDFQATITSSGKAVARFELWAYPLDSRTETL